MKPSNEQWTVVPHILPSRPKPTAESVAQRARNLARRAQYASGEAAIAAHYALQAADRARNPAIATAWLDEAEDALADACH